MAFQHILADNELLTREALKDDFSEFSEFQRLCPQSVGRVCHVKGIHVDNMCIAARVCGHICLNAV